MALWGCYLLSFQTGLWGRHLYIFCEIFPTAVSLCSDNSFAMKVTITVACGPLTFFVFNGRPDMSTLSSRAAGSSVAFSISAQGSVFITAPLGPDQYWPLSSVITNHISALALASRLELSTKLHEVLVPGVCHCHEQLCIVLSCQGRGEL